MAKNDNGLLDPVQLIMERRPVFPMLPILRLNTRSAKSTQTSAEDIVVTSSFREHREPRLEFSSPARLSVVSSTIRIPPEADYSELVISWLLYGVSH